MQKTIFLIVSFVVFVVLSLEYTEFNIRRDEIGEYEKFNIADAHLNLQNDRSIALETETNKLLLKLATEDNISSSEKLSIRKKLCNLNISYGVDKVEISDSYICLAKIEESEGNILQAIKNASYASDLLGVTENSNYLSDLVINGAWDEAISILQKYNFPKYGWVCGSSEIAILEEFAKSSNKTLSANANYRLSLIYGLGRVCGELERNMNIERAFEYQKATIDLLSIKPKKITNIGFVFNEKYVQYGATTITSILLNSDLDNKYNFYVIYDGLKDPISEESKRKLSSLSSLRDFEIDFIPFPEEIIKSNEELFSHNRDKQTYPRLVYFKILLDKALPNLERILVLDVDILVFRDLYDLENIEMDKYFVAAAKTPASFLGGRIGRKGDCESLPVNYYNSGVMVQNLKLMRQEDFYSKILEVDKNYRCDHRFPEQDNLNIASSGRTLYIPSKWNMIARDDDFEILYPSSYSPFIIHYTLKPFDKKYVDKVQNKENLPQYISLYYAYNDFAKKMIDRN